MESHRKRSRQLAAKWCCYALLMLLCAVLQTVPGLFQLGQAKPLYLLPLCLAVAAVEDEFAGALFGVVCGLMWDYTAGRTVGLLALTLMLLCFAMSVAVQLYLQCSAVNFVLIASGAALLVLSADFLFFYLMPGYAGAAQQYMRTVPFTVLFTAPAAAALFYLVKRISEKFHIDNGVV